MRLFSTVVSVLALGLTAAVSAEACPRLDGNYTCTYDGSFGHRVFELTGKTLDERGATVYVVNGKKIYTDGQQHHTDSLPILEQWVNNIDYRATCKGNAVNVEGTGTIKSNGQKAGLVGSLTANSDGSLRAVFNVSVAGFIKLPFDVPCKKR